MLLLEYLRSGNAPKIGMWWCECCERDLYRIESDDDDVVRASPPFLPGAQIFESEREGFVALVPDGLENLGQDEIDYWVDLFAHADELQAAREILREAIIDRYETPNAGAKGPA